MNRVILPEQKIQYQQTYKRKLAAVNHKRETARPYEREVNKNFKQNHNITSIAHKKSLERKREAGLLTIMLISFMITGVALISQYGMVLSTNYQVQQTSQRLEQLKEEKESLQRQVRQLSSLDRIETIAIKELGMKYPENEQWLLVSTREN